jgi:hypothetical protein
MDRKTKTLAVITLIAVISGMPAAGVQTSGKSLPPEILACANEVDVMVRLSCYDREIAALKTTTVAPDLAVTPTATATATPILIENENAAPIPVLVETKPVAATASQAVTETTPVAPAETREPEQESDSVAQFGFERPREDITAAVASIRKRPYGELIISLDNGQVWEQKHTDRRFKLRIGETVTIKKSKVAGYRLSGDSNRSIQVVRRK